MIMDASGLSEGIFKHLQLKKKSAATALNTVLASVHIQMS
jgi:nucleoid DNA-binding protein